MLLSTTAASLLLALPVFPVFPVSSGADASTASHAAYAEALDRSIERVAGRLRSDLVLYREHPNWNDPWRVQSEHYEVQTSAGYPLGRRVALALEGMLGHFQRVLRTDSAPTRRVPVRLFPTVELYNAFGQDADVHSSILGGFYATHDPALPIAVVLDPNETLVNMWATHAALHEFLAGSFATQPDTWIVEGLASYFAFYWDQDWGRAELRRLVESGEFLGLETLLGDDLDAYARAPHTRFVELGMLFTYLLHFREETRMGAEGDAADPTTSFQDFLVAALAGNGRTHPFATTYRELAGEIEEDFRSLEWYP